MLRRARIKLAPNVGAASRQQRVLAPETTSVVEPVEPISQADESSAVLLDASAKIAPTPAVASVPCFLPPPPPSAVSHSTPSAAQPPLSEVECSQSNTDKENVIASTSKEKSHEGKDTSVSSAEEPIPASSSSLSRFKAARNKVRPIIRDGSHRIRTFSSASESEDDVGKRKTRTPLSPVKKSIVASSKKDVADHPVAHPAEPELGKKKKKKPSEKSKLELKREATKRKFAEGGLVDRSNITMFDLIYVNLPNAEEP